METIKLFLIYVLSGLVVLLLISTYVVYLLSKKIYNHKWRAIHQSVQLTNIFYIFACIIMGQVLFDISLFWLIVLLHLFMLVVIIIYQWKKQTDISLQHGFKIVWRISFLIFFISYFVLATYGILKHIFLL